MGLKINPYTIFKAATSDYYGNNHLKDAVNKFFKDYKAVAFIIHDPIKHSDFDHYLSEIFIELSNQTGQELLFFTFLHSTKISPFSSLAKGMGYFDSMSFLDKSFSSTMFANELGIDSSDLPCVVIAKNINSKEFYYKSLIHKKDISILNTICKSIEHEGYLNETLLLKESFQNGCVELDQNIGRSLSNFYLFLDAENSVEQNNVIESKVNYFHTLKQKNNSFEINNLVEQLGFQISHLKSYQNKLIKKSNTSYQNSFEETLIFEPDGKLILNNLDKTQLKNHNLLYKNQPILDFIRINRPYLEDNSLWFLNTAQHALNSFTNEGDQLDYSPCAIMIGKTFELEISYSIVHWMRQFLGIEMPFFYGKVKPNFYAKIKPILEYGDGHEIDLNKQFHGKWMSPPIGQAYLAFKEISKKKKPNQFREQHINRLVVSWKNINNLRNLSSHTEIFSKKQLTTMLFYLYYLSNHDIYKKLHLLKTSLRS